MSLDPSTWSAWGLAVALLAAAAAILLAGIAATRRADVIADRSGLGEAMVGAVLLGGTTSLAGAVTAIVAAWEGAPSLAISSAVGGIAVQTAFLAIADLTYRRANLEHAAASPAILSQGALLVTLLGVAIVAYAGPEATVFAVHPASLALVALYVGGLRLLHQTRSRPMWFARQTSATVVDEPDADHAPEAGGPNPARLYGGFLLLAAVLAAAGFVVAHVGLEVADRSGLDQTAIGALLTGVATSLPELVTTLAAVRQGALTLAVGGIVGGNLFDTLFLAASDVAFRDGSIYHRMGDGDLFLVAVSIVMTGVLLLGLLRREPKGIAGIGFESALVLALYAGTVWLLL